MVRSRGRAAVAHLKRSAAARPWFANFANMPKAARFITDLAMLVDHSHTHLHIAGDANVTVFGRVAKNSPKHVLGLLECCVHIVCV